MHRMLLRQLNRFFGPADSVPAHLRNFINAVDEAYETSEAEQKHLANSYDQAARDLQDRNRLLVQKAWEYGRQQVLEGDWDMVIFDEINYAISYGLIPVPEVVDMLRRKPEMLHVVVTGRNAKDEIIALADTVTEMRPIKHAYEKGTAAQKGIEF